MCHGNATAKPDAASDLIGQLIDASDAKWSDHVAVAGLKSLDVCLGLYRRGYDHAICRSVTPAPHTPEQSADVLWVLGDLSEQDHVEALSVLGRDLRPGGRLVVGLPQGVPQARIRRLLRMLVDRGFLPITAAEDSSLGNLLVCARKAARPRARAA